MPDDSRSPTPPIQTTVAPPRGLQIPRRFSDSVTATTYAPRTITDPGTGEEITIEAPTQWSDHAVTILATKYRRKTGVPIGAEPWSLPLTFGGLATRGVNTPTGGETSARQIFHRLAGCWASWGLRLGYFDQQNARVFADEIVAMLEQQRAAPNSPQWFNTGLYWAYNIEGTPQGHYAIEHTSGSRVEACTNTYERPQVPACFIQPVTDDLCSDDGIMGLLAREALLFKGGSGTGTNFSAIRGKGEPLSGGGSSSGLLSFLGILDRAAGAIKSGGTTRRAAKMVVLDADHPDIEAFIDWKMTEERKLEVLIAGGFGGDGFETEAHATVGGQNANNSIRVTDEFMAAVDGGQPWYLTRRTDGVLSKTVNARTLWTKICTAAHACADPGLQFDTTINEWHTCPESGRINASNPCSEYMFLDNTACNLASLNLAAFLRPNGEFDFVAYEHAVRLWVCVLDISATMVGYPSRGIAEESRKFRTIGLGYANLGGALMRKGIPYDSIRGRDWCSWVTSTMAATAWQTSAELAALLGTFPEYDDNKVHLLRVVPRHRGAPASRARRAPRVRLRGSGARLRQRYQPRRTPAHDGRGAAVPMRRDLEDDQHARERDRRRRLAGLPARVGAEAKSRGDLPRQVEGVAAVDRGPAARPRRRARRPARDQRDRGFNAWACRPRRCSGGAARARPRRAGAPGARALVDHRQDGCRGREPPLHRGSVRQRAPLRSLRRDG